MPRSVVEFFGVMMTLVVTGGLAYTVFSVITALNRRLNPPKADLVDNPELEAIHSQLAEIDGLRERVADLEERLDFAERMLAQHVEAQRLGAGEPPR